MTTSRWEIDVAATLRGPRVLLRAAADRDADAFAEAARESAATIGPWMAWARADYRPDEALAWFDICRRERASRDAFEWLVFDDAGRLLGGCGLNQFNRAHRMANLGYWTRASAERRGYASEAARLAAAAGLAAGLERVEIIADVRNVASQRVAEKAGATREGVLRARIWHDGAARDAAVLAIVRGDLR